MSAPSWPRFLLATAIGALTIWIVFALWVVCAPMTILNAGQVPLIAKDDLLRQCPRSDIVVFGDSRADAAIDPRLIALPTVNLARGGGSLEEDYYRIGRYLACGNKPRLLIFAYVLPEYLRVSPRNFWQGMATAHVLGMAERNEILRRIASTGDDALRPLDWEEIGPYAMVPALYKSILYQLYFPPLYSSNVMGSLEHGILFRYYDNIRIYNATITNHGRSDYHALPHAPGPDHDIDMWSGRPHPAIEHYLLAILTLLKNNEIPTMIMVMPVNDATWSGIAVPVREGLMHYLNELPRQFPNVVVSDPDLPHWPDEYFGDTTMHLTARGTEAVAAILNRCVPAMLAGETAASCGLAVPPP
jgi:hypothetical protein